MEKEKFYIDVILEKEKKRNEYMQEVYMNALLQLPKGSLFIKKINGREYCYLRYREKEKVILKYVGTINQIDNLKSMIEERKRIVRLLDMLKKENKRIQKMEKNKMNERSYETLLYSIVTSVVDKLMNLNNWSEDEALEKFTTSKLYTYLEKEETKVWQYSALMLAKLLNDEIEGHLVLPEV